MQAENLTSVPDENIGSPEKREKNRALGNQMSHEKKNCDFPLYCLFNTSRDPCNFVLQPGSIIPYIH